MELPLEKAMALHKKMRENCEISGAILNSRVNVPEIQKCETCNKSYEDLMKSARMRDWFLNQPYYDPDDRKIIRVRHFCSAACVSLYNNKTQGVRGMPDRGMLRSDNPANHPRG